MSGIFGQVDVIEGPGRTLAVDDKRIDTISHFDPELGYVVQRPAAIQPEEARQVEIDGWRHALASVEHRIATWDPSPSNRLPWQPELTADQIERAWQSLVGERNHCLAEIARLEGAAAPVEGKQRRRR